MTAHKHVDIITAKLNNMELVVFYKLDDEEWWQYDSDLEALPCDTDLEYFLCLPQHKEAVLHVLNGGIAQITNASHWNDPMDVWISGRWMGDPSIWYMSPYCQSRVKPKKEKRWIGFHPLGATTPLGKTYKFVSDVALHQLTSANKPFCEWKFIEIEIEV